MLNIVDQLSMEIMRILADPGLRGYAVSLVIIHEISSLARDWRKGVTWRNMPQLKLGNIRVIFRNFQNCVCCAKYLKDNKCISLQLAENMFGYLSLDIICSSKLTVSLQLCFQKTVVILEQIMSVDKYFRISSRQMGDIVYIYPFSTSVFCSS